MCHLGLLKKNNSVRVGVKAPAAVTALELLRAHGIHSKQKVIQSATDKPKACSCMYMYALHILIDSVTRNVTNQ